MTHRLRLPIEGALVVFFLASAYLVQEVVYPDLSAAELLLTTASVLLYAVMAIASFRLRPDDPRVRSFIAFSIFCTLTFLCYPATPQIDGSWLQALWSLGHPAVFLLCSATLLHTCALLPEQSPVVRRWPQIVPAVYSLAAVLIAVSSLVSLDAHYRWWAALPATAAEAARFNRTIVLACYALAALGGSALVAQAGVHARSISAKRQALALCMGLLPYGLFRVAGALMPALRGLPAFATLETLVVFLLPVGLFIAIMGFGLFEGRSRFHRNFRVALTLGLMVAGGGMLASTVSLMLPELDPVWGFALATVLAGALLFPAMRYLSGAIDTLFFPERLAMRHLTHDVLQRVAEYTDLRLRAGALAASVGDAVGVNRVALYVVSEDGSQLELAGAAGAGAMPRSLEPAAVEQRPAPTPFARLMPISFRGRLNAVLALGDKADGEAITDEEARELGLAAVQVSAVVENARLFALATRDSLTGLFRRAVFEERLSAETARFGRERAPFAVLMLDVDNFKRLNDTYGHQTGDQVLREVAAVVAGRCRETDTAARYGGEELVVLLPGADATAVATVGEKIRAGIAELQVSTGKAGHSEGGTVGVTVSAGAAVMQPGITAVQLIEAADAALYEAKRSGKNRVVLAGGAGGLLPAVG
jgi:diguanylate cyclase (GGDEF)-like protein